MDLQEKVNIVLKEINGEIPDVSSLYVKKTVQVSWSDWVYAMLSFSENKESARGEIENK